MFFGGKISFEKVVREHQASVRRLMLTLTKGDDMLSDDLAQEVFIKAYLSWNTFRAMSSTKTWLFRIAYNVFYDYMRANHMDIIAYDNGHELEQQVYNDNSDKVFDVNNAMQMLSLSERLCVTLALIEGEKIKDVAKITKLKENTVKSHIKRGKEKLATYLKQNGYGK